MRDYEIPDRQAEVDWLFETYLKEEEPQTQENVKPSPLQDDTRIIALCRSAKNSDKFLRLFEDGDDSEHSSRSEADLSLISIMAFYTQDPSQLDRLFRLSSLMRPKWDARRRSDGATYSTVTIEKALSSLVATYSPERPQEEEDSALVAKRFTKGINITPPEQVIKGIVHERLFNIIYGDSGSGKSYIVLNMALALSRGDKEWFGYQINRQHRVLYLDAEFTFEDHYTRAWAIANADSSSIDEDNLLFVDNQDNLAPSVFLTKALELCKAEQVDVIILDALGDLIEGEASSSKDFQSFYRRSIVPFEKAGITVIAVDHQAKMQSGELQQQKGPFGSGYKKARGRSVVQVELTHSEQDYHISILRQTKTSRGANFTPFTIHTRHCPARGETKMWKEDLQLEELCEEMSIPLSERIRIALSKEPMTHNEVANYINSQPRKVYKALKRMEADGTVSKIGERWETV